MQPKTLQKYSILLKLQIKVLERLIKTLIARFKFRSRGFVIRAVK